MHAALMLPVLTLLQDILNKMLPERNSLFLCGGRHEPVNSSRSSLGMSGRGNLGE